MVYKNIELVPYNLKMDTDLQNSQLTYLLEKGYNIDRVNSRFKKENLEEYSGVFISNGPGDPKATGRLASQTIKKLIKILFATFITILFFCFFWFINKLLDYYFLN